VAGLSAMDLSCVSSDQPVTQGGHKSLKKVFTFSETGKSLKTEYGFEIFEFDGRGS